MARSISLKPGSIVFCGTVEYEVVSPIDFTLIKVRDVVNGEVRVVALKDISTHSSLEQKPPSSPLDCLTSEEREIVLRRFAIIKPAITKTLTKNEIVDLGLKHGLHYTTVYRMIKAYRETGDPSSLLPKTHNRGGKGKHRIPQAVEDIIWHHFEKVVSDQLVDITKISVSELHKEIKIKCMAARLKVPTWTTVADRLEIFFRKKKLERKRGRQKKSRRPTAGGIFPDAKWPLDVVQIDHTLLDIILVDDENREPIGRAFLSLAIDVCSRMVVGFSISLVKPGIFAVGQLISQCILPKQQFLESVGVDATWNVFGVMRTLFMDNAGEFRSEDFIPFEEEYLVEISWRPVATPEYGGHIERLAKTLNDKIHNEPGSTFSNIDQRGDYDSEGKACYTIDEIEKWLTILITKEYHETVHSELGMTPRERYELGIFGNDKTIGIGLPDIVEDQERLKLFLLPSFTRTIQRQGVEIEKIEYFHDILRHWVNLKGEDGKARKYLFKRDPRRISPIYFFNPDQKEYFKIPYRDLTRAPMTEIELKASKRRCKEKGINDPNEQQIFAAHAERMEIRANSIAKTKQARREKVAEKRRVKDLPQEPKNVSPSAAAEAPEGYTDDISRFYEDSTLLDGVTVKNTQKED